MASMGFPTSGMPSGGSGAHAPITGQDPTPGKTWDAMESYFECITTCSLDDGECVTRCVETLREHN